MDLKFSRYHVALDIDETSLEKGNDLYLYATRTGQALRVSRNVYDTLRDGRIDELSYDTKDTLVRLELLVPYMENEFSCVLTRNKLALDSLDTLNTVIQPTGNCQLGCGYCGQKHRKEKTNQDVQEAIFQRIRTNLVNSRYTRLAVEWYGGEPLMAYSDICHMSTRLIELCDSLDVEYSAHMITNGLSLRPHILDNLVQLGCTDFQITLDGTAETHNKSRPTKLGANTFELILKNIEECTKLEAFTRGDCRILIRINVNKENYTEVPTLIDLLARMGLPSRGVSVDFEPVVNWGDKKAGDVNFSLADYAELEIGWMLHAMRQGFAFFGFLPKRRAQPCMVVEPDGEVYDAFGNVYPCYEFPYTPAYEKDEYRLGHLATIDSNKNNNAVTRNWFDQIDGDVSPCKHCNLFPVCGGGCPKKWLHGERGCPSFKENIQDRLALHVLSRQNTLSYSVAAD